MSTHPKKNDAKRVLGLEPGTPHLVALAATTPGDFLSDLLSVIYVCDDQDPEISVMCAGNNSLFRLLQEDLGHLNTIHLYDTANKESLLLDSADLLLTDRLDSVLTKALKRRLPLVLIGSAAQENTIFRLVRQGCAAAADDCIELAEICIRLLNNEDLRAKMSEAI